MTREELAAQNLPFYLKQCSMLELETVLRALAGELANRAMPDVFRLWSYAGMIERYRLASGGRRTDG